MRSDWLLLAYLQGNLFFLWLFVLFSDDPIIHLITFTLWEAAF